MAKRRDQILSEKELCQDEVVDVVDEERYNICRQKRHLGERKIIIQSKAFFPRSLQFLIQCSVLLLHPFYSLHSDIFVTGFTSSIFQHPQHEIFSSSYHTKIKRIKQRPISTSLLSQIIDEIPQSSNSDTTKSSESAEHASPIDSNIQSVNLNTAKRDILIEASVSSPDSSVNEETETNIGLNQTEIKESGSSISYSSKQNTSLQKSEEDRIHKLRTLRRLQEDRKMYRSITTSQLGSDEGLSRYNRRLVTPTRQRFVTGKYPLYVSVRESPTRKWLSKSKKFDEKTMGMSSSEVYVNGTFVERSLASFDRYAWEEEEAGTKEGNTMISSTSELLSLELVAEVHVRKPGYLNIMPKEILKSNNYITKYAASQESDTSSQFLQGWFTQKQQKRKKEKEEKDNEDLHREMLWVTDFSLTKPGGITYVDTKLGKIQRLGINDDFDEKVAKSSFLQQTMMMLGNYRQNNHITFGWPNEVGRVPLQNFSPSKKAQKQSFRETEYQDAMLVTDGFLVPGRENGGLYVVQNLGQEEGRETKVSLTEEKDGWFYHRAIWIDLTGDGRKSILAARAKFTQSSSSSSSGTSSSSPSSTEDNYSSTTTSQGIGELVWLECPKPHHYSEDTPLDAVDTIFDPFAAQNLPWKLRVLAEGPDVMFSVADLDQSDNTVEVLAAQFFGKKVSLHSISIGQKPEVTFSRVIDHNCGASFSSVLACLDSNVSEGCQPKVVDSGSTVETFEPGDIISHLLVTSHECSFAPTTSSQTSDTNNSTATTATASTSSKEIIPDGGSLFAYKIPQDWKTDNWERQILATGFRVRGQLGNMINPGAPGFCYTFHPQLPSTGKRPYIAIAGDCAEAAYILQPSSSSDGTYSLLCEIQCGATVGSLAIGYQNFCGAEGQLEKYAKIYVPCFEKDKILVFAFGKGEEDLKR